MEILSAFCILFSMSDTDSLVQNKIVMGALVQKQFCHGCDCPKTILSWVRLSKNNFVMGAIVQKQFCH
jgi:hypothetical protein